MWQSLDEKALHWINSDLQNSFFDWLMPVVTDFQHSPYGWVMAVLVLTAIVYVGRWLAAQAILLAAVAVACSDSFNHFVLKQFFQRVRPTDLPGVVLRTFPHAGFSFPSNHAANNMAFAVVMSWFFPKWAKYFFVWALVIGFSRIYVGVHYPADVLGGFAVGAFWGMVVVAVFETIKKTANSFRAQNSNL